MKTVDVAFDHAIDANSRCGYSNYIIAPEELRTCHGPFARLN